MENKNHCRMCGIEIDFDPEDPSDICSGCWDEKKKSRKNYLNKREIGDLYGIV